jgi:hypothetical protein
MQMLECIAPAAFAGNLIATTEAAAEIEFIKLNHFGAMLLFALLITVGFAALGQRKGIERFRYALWSFALFVLIGVGIAWVMYPFSR